MIKDTPDKRSTKTLLLKNCFYVWPGDGQAPLRNTDILVKDNQIKEIGAHLKADADRVIDASNHVVLPGFVNTHHHFYQTLTRNIPAVQNAKLFDWLVYLYEIWKHLDEEAIYYSSLLAMGELLKTGCTLTTDHHYLYPAGIDGDITAIQFRAAEQLGMRFSPSRGSMSLSKKDGGLPPDTVVQDEDTILADSQRVIETFHDASDFSMRKIILAPCSPFSVSKHLMKETAALARRYNVRLHTHLAETADENAYCVKMYGKRPLEVMMECDFIGNDVSYAHGIFFTDAELKILDETRTHIAHCPTSNMRLGSGICRVVEMLPTRINVGLAVDGSASNDSSDMLGEVRHALLLQRVKYGASAVTVDDVLKMATENGARLLNFPKVGVIRPGYAADLSLFNIRSMEYAGALSDPAAAIVFSGYNHGTDYTVVNGRIVVENGRLAGIDEEEIAARACTLSEQMIRRQTNHGNR